MQHLLFVFFVVVPVGWRWGRHLYHQLQCVGDRKTLDCCCVSWQPRPDPGPAFELHSHRSITANENCDISVVYVHISSHGLVLIHPFLSPGETHAVSGTSFSYTLAADVALLTRNIKIIGVEYPQMMEESFGARLLVGTYSWAGIDYKGNDYLSNVQILMSSYIVF